MNTNLSDYTNILIIGCGGAGLSSAIEAMQNNLSVKVLGKRLKNDAHTVLAAGGINASFGNLDNNDSWEQHFADTFLEGYEIGDPKAIELMAREAINCVNEIDSWGANFQKLKNGKFDQRFFGAHTYRRTCFCGDYTGKSILDALLKKASYLKMPIFDSEYVTDLLIEEDRCFGATSINLISGEKNVHLADATILCTGGHTRIWKRSSSRKYENNGDGLFLALKSGCKLIDMEMVQFHPTGMLFPEEMEGMLVTEAVRGEGGKLYNSRGERYMKNYDNKRMELSTRDTIARANYLEIKEGRGTQRGGVILDISHIKKEKIIARLPTIYNQILEHQNIDISEEPFEVAPTAHYSMGGISVKAESHGTDIEGLFAAGEVAGGLHGANRLGGNSLAEILVFGKIAGYHASKYSKNLKIKSKPIKSIRTANENIDKKLVGGKNDPSCLQRELQKIMWEHCGVVKDKKNLEKGIFKIASLKNEALSLDTKIINNDYRKITDIFDLEASIIAAESTLKSALAREETRGAHNRSDFPQTNQKSLFNIEVKLENNQLELNKINCSIPDDNLIKIIKKTKEVKNFKGKLIE